MRKIKSIITYLVSCVFLFTSCASNDEIVDIKLIKATSNYPTENYSWYNAPPRLEMVFEVRNNSNESIAVPMKATVVKESFVCSSDSINFYQIAGRNYALLKPGETKSFALKSKSDELIRAMHNCNIKYPGDFFDKLLSEIKMSFSGYSDQSIGDSMQEYKILQNLEASKEKNFYYEAPVTPVEE